MNKKFTDSWGPEHGQDDRTDFLYDREDREVLKRLVDGVDLSIYRDGSIEDLDVLIRKAKTPRGVEFAVEMVPVQGGISLVETPWTVSAQGNYKTFSYPDHVNVGIMQGGNVVQTLSIWYSRECYMKANPESDLDIENIIREHTPQEPNSF